VFLCGAKNPYRRVHLTPYSSTVKTNKRQI